MGLLRRWVIRWLCRLGFTCRHGGMRFCKQCVREDVIAQLGYVPRNLEALLALPPE
jgi:hypothetical protein